MIIKNREKFFLFFSCLFVFTIICNANAATYYMAESGCSDVNPGTMISPWCTFSHSLDTLLPGDMLIVRDGTYHEQLNIDISGLPNQPITIQAENIGKAIIDMQTDGTGILINSEYQNIISYVVIDGFFVKGHGEYNAVVVKSPDLAQVSQMANHIVMRNIGSFGSAVCSNTHSFSIDRTRDSLFEDIYAFGNGRKAIEVYGAVNVTVRRAVVRFDHWDGTCYKPNDPRVDFTAYNTHNSTFENIIAIDSGTGSGDRAGIVASGNDAPGQILNGSKNNEYYGIISLNNYGNGVILNGGTANPLTGIYFENIIAYNNTAYGVNIQDNVGEAKLNFISAGGNGQTGIRFNPYPSYVIDNITLTNSISFDNGYSYTAPSDQLELFENNSALNNLNSGSYPANIDTQYMPQIDYLPRPEYVSGYERGATVFNRTVDGVVTSDSLWPYPNEDIIKGYMCDEDLLINASRTGSNRPTWCDTDKTLTEYVWEYLGSSCPRNVCNYDENVTLDVFDNSPQKTGQTVTFYANYTDGGVPVTDLTCMITYNAHTYEMHKTSSVFYWQDDFNTGGNIDYEVTCGSKTKLGIATIDDGYETYYVCNNASTCGVGWSTGSDSNSCTNKLSPCLTISAATNKMAGGDTVIVGNGTYTGLSNRIRQLKSGSGYKYTTIKTEHDFGVKLVNIPVGTWQAGEETVVGIYKKERIEIRGFLIIDPNSNRQRYAVSAVDIASSNYTKIINVGVRFKNYTSSSSYGGPINVGASKYTLIEDCFVTGDLRYGIIIGGPASKYNIVRRGVVRWDYSNTSQPRAGLAAYGGYKPGNGALLGSMNHTMFQNCISIDDNNGTVHKDDTFTGGFSAPAINYDLLRIGCIALNDANYGYHTSEHTYSLTPGSDNRDVNSVGWDLGSIAYWREVSPEVNARSGVFNCTFNTGNVDSDMVDVVYADNNLFFNVSMKNIVEGSGDESNVNFNDIESANLKYIVNSSVPGKGATIIKRYGISGTIWGEPGYDELTDENLWPFPNEAEIKELFSMENTPQVGSIPPVNDVKRGFAANGNGLYGGPITLTSYIWEYLGSPCPEDICDYDTNGVVGYHVADLDHSGVIEDSETKSFWQRWMSNLESFSDMFDVLKVWKSG